ncbi:bifunctional glucose-6-phosphate/mannose-6-phosphate isomerase [Acrocarpospora corrugata]|uniref:Bifunctional glucose-6-phosphate/mannose-6-phosphate isomerase n=1 Tax=Acrocarpospora corrugata TaxID=35763 RepID=A0A5M3W6D5_9ACTN|nr:SIS domain-containing protein [Acrocarpospora corrugata]GES02803.1 bifunctional glucose-6-phosphate/mannose-6-phosphate isomerase [Acrocarpospora corrugata]
MNWEPEQLDDQAYLAAGDPSGLLVSVASSAAQIRTAHRAAAEAAVDAIASEGRPRAIVVAGTGVAGVAGDVLDAVCGHGSSVPVSIVRGYRLPGWVGAADLVMAVSGTGDTEETLTVAAEAARRGCRLLAVGGKGSPLQALATQRSAPFVPVDPAARTALWPLVVPLIAAAGSLGLVEAGVDLFESVAKRLEDVAHRCRPSSESFINPGKTLADEIAETIPVIWGSSRLMAVAAARLAGQLNENARYPAIWGELPEAGHNQLAALDGPLAQRDIFADGPTRSLRLFIFRDAEEHPQVAKARQLSVRLAQDRGVPVSEIAAEAGHPLERLATVIGLGDYAGVYLSLGYGGDPAPVSAVAELRARIGQ